MHNFIKIFCGLVLIATCSGVTNTTNTVTAASKNQTITLATVQNITPNSSVFVEGGSVPPSVVHDETHLGREHVVDKSSTLTSAFNNTANKTVAGNLEEKPVTETLQDIDLGISKKNDNTKVVGKKGAEPDNSTSEITNTQTKTTVTAINTPTVQPKNISVIKPKKPIITEHGDESFVPNDAKYNKSNARTSNLYNSDTVLEKKSNRADYVIPIVAVILSVPLVAVIISMLYKRGKYWWQHRNYRRMDFLIEGMYNN